MKKELILEFETGTPPKYKKWAKEAVEKFVSLFPEFKDSLVVKLSTPKQTYTRHDVEGIIAEGKRLGANVNEQNIWDSFEEQPDGTFLRKNSIDWYIQKSKLPDGSVNLSNILHLKQDPYRVPDDPTKCYANGPLKISICNQVGVGENENGHFVSGARGMSDTVGGPCIAIKTCEAACSGFSEEQLEAYFKDIIIHELGHSFNATHEQRKNCVENLGSHCTDAACLMYEYGYTNASFDRRRAEAKDNPFCNDCMESMRDYMQNHLKLDRTLLSSNDNELDDYVGYFSNIDDEERAFIKAYSTYLTTNNIQRSAEDIFLDKILIVAEMRRSFNTVGKRTKNFTPPYSYNFNRVAKDSWNSAEKFKSLIKTLYEAKKYALYSTELFDKTHPPTRDADGKIPYFACGGQTPKGDELAKVLLDSIDMDFKGDMLQDQWVYRAPKGRMSEYTKKETVQRFAINAKPDIDLIKKLDKFAQKYGVFYKTAMPVCWHKRNDSVVIYCSEPLNENIINELKGLVAPHIRKDNPKRLNDLDGQLIADGVIIAPEPNPVNISRLYDELKKVNPFLAESLKKEVDKQTKEHPNNPLSLGQFEAYRLILDSYNKFKQQTNSSSKDISVSNTNLPENSEKDSDPYYKIQLRGILRDSAKKENLEYKEYPQKKLFQADLISTNGIRTRIQASGPKNISLVAQNEKGETVTPDFRRFMDIVSYAQIRKSSVSFGNIKSPEFKAKLMIACLQAQPPVRMKGAPSVNEEFLNTLSDSTSKALHDAYYSLKIEQKSSSYKELEISRLRRCEELKSNTKNLTAREWAEYFYHKDQLVGSIALDEAKKRFNSSRPREAEWSKITGLEPVKFLHYENKRPGDASWKLHFDVMPNPEDKTTKEIIKILDKLDIDYKTCGGEENGKGLTVYVGSYKDACDLTAFLQTHFKDKVRLPTKYTDQFNQEKEFCDIATGRFMIAANYDAKTQTETPVFDEVYPTNIRGISPARLTEIDSIGFLIANAKQLGLISKETPDSYEQIKDAKQLYDVDILENYVSHCLYSKHLKTFYYGAKKEKFEKDLFCNKMPDRGSIERRKWDILASRYESFIEKNRPEKIVLMKKHIDGYKPIDFSKINQEQNRKISDLQTKAHKGIER